MAVCEFCNRNKKTATTEFNGDYCESCYRLVILSSLEAIREIRGMPLTQRQIKLLGRQAEMEKEFDEIIKGIR